MKILLIIALAARAAAADPQPPDRTASLVGPPSIDNVMVPPEVDAQMALVPPLIDQAILIGPARDLFEQLGQVVDAVAGGLSWLVTATVPRAI